MQKRKILSIIILFIISLSMCSKNKSIIDSIDIPHEIFKLENGLTVIFHEDKKSPIVAVNVWYHVGSKNEKKGKTGFAHLFEHLMFNGSENHKKDYLKSLINVGATNLNGTTSNDRTNYFQTVPKEAFDRLLWLESDRMGHLLGAIDQAKLDEQRGVVQNEKRQYENMPYTISWDLITEATWPEGHPYSWSVIGSMEDLNAASLSDVREWFEKYYGPNNAVLSIAGDIDIKTVKEKVKKYFGDIPSGPPLSRFKVNIAKMKGTIRQSVQDRVPHSKVYKVWNIPQYNSKELIHLDLLSDILAKGKTSRLYKRLVYDEQIASEISSWVYPREIASQFNIIARVKPGIDIKRIENAIDEELNKLLKDGPSANELERIKTSQIAGFLRGIEKIGGFGGKTDILAHSYVYTGNADYYKTWFKEVEKASSQDIVEVGKKWLSDGQYILHINPYPKLKNDKRDLSIRKKIPEIGEKSKIAFPEIVSDKLSNGLKIYLINRKSVPIVNFELLINAGYAADKSLKAGTAKMTVDMLNEGTKKYDALEINDKLENLGAQLRTSSNLDQSIISLSALKINLVESLEMLSEILLQPEFPEKELERLKKNYITRIEKNKSNPRYIPYRVLPGLIYGKEHSYGNPLTGNGTEQSISSLKVDDLKKFYSTWFKPNNASLIIVGDITMAELKSKLENVFDGWDRGNVPDKKIDSVKHKDRTAVFLIDKPQAPSSVIVVGQVAIPKKNDKELAIQMMNKVLGGIFSSRINMNLREDKHWTYGARSVILDAIGQRPFWVSTSVQTDKTKESMIEIYKELNDIIRSRPVTKKEFHDVQKKMSLELSGLWETNTALVGELSNIVRFGYPIDYYSTFSNKVNEIKHREVVESAHLVVKPGKLIWVVIGDKSKIENKIKSLNYGKITYIDADGKEI